MSQKYATHRSSAALIRATPWAIVALLAVAALGAYFVFVSEQPFAIDESWRAFVRLTPGTVPFSIAAFLAEVGSATGVAACGAISAALLLAMGERRSAGALITALIIGVALSEAAKTLVDRPRPIDSLYAFTGTSYPSGHSMGAAALAFSLAFAISAYNRTGRGTLVSRPAVVWTWIIAICWTLTMMWSRTALGVHWLSDTISGALLGIAAAVLAARMWGSHPRRRS